MSRHWYTGIWEQGKAAMSGTVSVRSLAIGAAAVLFVLLLPRALGPYTSESFRRLLGRPDPIDLTELITKVKAQLSAAERASIDGDEAPLLSLKDVELEVAFVVDTKSTGEVRLVPVSGSTAGELSLTQRIKLHLTPVGAVPELTKAASAPLLGAKTPDVIGPSPPPAKEGLKGRDGGIKR